MVVSVTPPSLLDIAFSTMASRGIPFRLEQQFTCHPTFPLVGMSRKAVDVAFHLQAMTRFWIAQDP